MASVGALKIEPNPQKSTGTSRTARHSDGSTQKSSMSSLAAIMSFEPPKEIHGLLAASPEVLRILSGHAFLASRPGADMRRIL